MRATLPFSCLLRRRRACLQPSASAFAWQHEIFFDPHVRNYSSKHPGALDPRKLIHYMQRELDETRRVRIANLVLQSLTVRFAKSLKLFYGLPLLLATNHHFLLVFQSLWRSFHRMRVIPPPKTDNDVAALREECLLAEHEHRHTLFNLKNGLGDAARLPSSVALDRVALDCFLREFLTLRMGRYLVVENFDALCDNPFATVRDSANGFEGVESTRVGVVDLRCSPAVVARVAADTLEKEAVNAGVRCPNFDITGDVDATVAFSSLFLYHSLYEVLRNSMEATASLDIHSVPSVRVDIAVDSQSGKVRVICSDRAGGVPPPILEHIFRFGVSGTQLGVETKRTSSARMRDQFATDVPNLAAIVRAVKLPSSVTEAFHGDGVDVGIEGVEGAAELHAALKATSGGGGGKGERSGDDRGSGRSGGEGEGEDTAKGGASTSSPLPPPRRRFGAADGTVTGPVPGWSLGAHDPSGGDACGIEESEAEDALRAVSSTPIGFGLPVANIMLRVLGGVIRVDSYEEFGTDATIEFTSLEKADIQV